MQKENTSNVSEQAAAEGNPSPVLDEFAAMFARLKVGPHTSRAVHGFDPDERMLILTADYRALILAAPGLHPSDVATFAANIARLEADAIAKRGVLYRAQKALLAQKAA